MNPVSIGARQVGPGQQTYVVAEIGSNHGGQLQRALDLVAGVADAGADAVKFQSWIPRLLQNYREETADGRLVDSTVLPILEKYVFPREWHAAIADVCQTLGIHFLSTPFDVDTCRFLVSLGVPALKISSSDLVYDELVAEAGASGLPILLSVGMATLGEIEHALELIGHSDVVLLHCVATYPPVLEEANLRAIQTLSQSFGLQVGFSDHFPGHEVDVAAVALGACVIEKHVTLSRTDGAPDSSHALELDEFREMVESIRQLERSLGDGRKRCMPSESGGLVGGRRCLYAARDLEAGTVLSREDIAVVRPNIGELQPRHLDVVIGRRLRLSVEGGRPLRWSDFEP